MHHNGTRHYANLLILMGLIVTVPGAWLLSGAALVHLSAVKRISINITENINESGDQSFENADAGAMGPTAHASGSFDWRDADANVDIASSDVFKHQRKLLRINPPNGPPCFAFTC